MVAAAASPSASGGGGGVASPRFPISPSQSLTRFSCGSILAARSRSHGAAAAATSASRKRSTNPRNQPLDSSPSRLASSTLSSAPTPFSHSGSGGGAAVAAAVAAGPVLAFPFAGDIRDFAGDDFTALAAADAAGFADSSTTSTASGDEIRSGEDTDAADDLARVSVITAARDSAVWRARNRSTAGCGFCSSAVELTSAYLKHLSKLSAAEAS
ncbi:Os09g0516750 [Oryza sativa Japonica Group]|uniref:Os09g0516750 protein n=1 Tax=Oryza sativa subsp. japonica TaxID=39947 RepID=A0A0P0XQK3_ORYSJ|nr:hypothetical protein EE612_048953 [Oryza sativa]BAT08968.1 Os09g0516750 [Oryza sativa Japonica Group]